MSSTRSAPEYVAQLDQPLPGLVEMRVGGEPKAEAELGIVFDSELDHAGPRPSALVVHGVVGRLPP